MPDKELRIVIADTSLPRLIQLEKSLNRLGYHRILPVQVFEDLWVLTHKLNDTSYVLIANKDLALDAKFDWVAFCQTIRKTNHALLYESHPAELISISLTSSRAFSTRCVSVPNDELIEAFMISADPTSPWEATWTNNPCEANSQLLVLENNDIREPLKPSE
ncbi:hypothetical protein ABH905_005213 [Pseudomonas frederiksbergensis]|uniref:histidine kinase n=1 Tax=Pseudomonas frederiksbergensis TaxID=104087 RepID=UPI003D1EDCE6